MSQLLKSQRGSILVVDDDALMRRGVERMLSLHWDVRTAACAKEALETLEKSEPTVLLTDYSMPGKNGLVLLEQAWRHHPSTRRFLMSGRHGAFFFRGTPEGLFEGFLHKPFHLDELLELLM